MGCDTGIGLATQLGIFRGDIVSAIGAGGKTTLLNILARELAEEDNAVALTTTTRIWPPSDFPLRLRDEVRLRIARGQVVALGRALSPDGKVLGLDPDTVCALPEMTGADIVLCEADGAAGRPLKAHGPAEPVIPACSTLVVVVLGLAGLGRPPAQVVHRIDEWDRVAGRPPTGTVTIPDIARLLDAALSRVPGSPRTVVVMTAGRPEEAAAVAARLARPYLVIHRLGQMAS